jgi:hypothetical protein
MRAGVVLTLGLFSSPYIIHFDIIKADGGPLSTRYLSASDRYSSHVLLRDSIDVDLDLSSWIRGCYGGNDFGLALKADATSGHIDGYVAQPDKEQQYHAKKEEGKRRLTML